jgi:pilus assembly protein CpaC
MLLRLSRRSAALWTLIAFGALGQAAVGWLAVARAQEGANDAMPAAPRKWSRPLPSLPPPAAAAADGKAPAVIAAGAASRPEAFIAEILEPEATMQVTLHRSKLVRTKAPVTRFSVTQPEVLDVVQYSPTEFELIGLKAGQTSLTLWFGERALRYLVTVALETAPGEKAAREYTELQAKINEMFPNSIVQLIPFADKLVVRGQARDSAEAAQILALLGAKGGQQAGYQAGGGINLGAAAKLHAGASDLPGRNLINLLDVPGEKQVMLKVRIAELSRTAMRKMSVDLHAASGHANFTSSSGISTIFSSVLNPEDLSLAIQAAASSSYSKILAEPNLVTLNGQSATFNVGGEFAVPTVVGIGGVSGVNTLFRSFGTSLNFTPTILDKDRIRLVVAPSISSLNTANSVEGIPGLNTQNVSTTVDLREGQWLAIAGLLQDQLQGSKAGPPLLSELPVLGSFFTHRSVKRDDTELLVLVSPTLIHPLDAQETPLVLPGMEITEPSDLSFWLGGAYVGKSDCDPRATVAAPRGSAADEANCRAMGEAMSRPAFQRSERYYVYGPHGLSR